MMDELTMQTKMPSVQKLISACELLKSIIDNTDYSPADNAMKQVQDGIISSLNDILDNKQCISVSVTLNTDNLFFGVVANPTITNVDLMSMLIEEDDMSLDRYMLEIDSKAVQILDPDDLAMYIIHDADAVTSIGAVKRIRTYIDTMLAKKDENLDIRSSINYSNLLIYGIKYTIRNLTNLLSISDSELKNWPRLESIRAKVISSVPEILHDVNNPEMSLLQWCFLVYNNMDTEYKEAIETLNKAKTFTGSQLEKDEIDKVIKSLRRAAAEIISEATVIENEMLTEAKGFSLFKNLKRNGLRGIEDDLYEYKVRIRNCTDQEDAIYILRCINSRIAILEDYLINEKGLNDIEVDHWRDVIDQYRMLRAEIGQKKFGSASKNFNAFLNIDYSKLDALDRGRYQNESSLNEGFFKKKKHHENKHKEESKKIYVTINGSKIEYSEKDNVDEESFKKAIGSLNLKTLADKYIKEEIKKDKYKNIKGEIEYIRFMRIKDNAFDFQCDGLYKYEFEDGTNEERWYCELYVKNGKLVDHKASFCD